MSRPLEELYKTGRIARKEVNLIKSQRISLALILLYPAIAILSIALAFGGTSLFGDLLGGDQLETITVSVLMPENHPFFDAQDFLDKIGQAERLELKPVSSLEELKADVALGQSFAGLEVIPPEQANTNVQVNIYTDNSSLLSSAPIISFVEFGVDKVSFETSTEILAGIWSDLNSIESTLSSEKEKTSEFIQALEEANQKLVALGEDLNAIEIAPLQENLETFTTYYDDTKQDLNESKLDMVDARGKIADYQIRVGEEKDNLQEYHDNLAFVRDNVAQAREDSGEPVSSLLQPVEEDLNARLEEVESSILELDGVSQDLNELDGKMLLSIGKMDLAEERLDDANVVVNDFNLAFASINSTLGEVKLLLEDASASREKTVIDLQNTKALLNDLVLSLDALKGYSPAYLVNPVSVDQKNLYQVEELEVITPTAIAIVLLLTCLLLSSVSVIIERSEGVAKRVELSPTLKASWIAGKLLGQLAFALLVSCLILAIAAFLFQVSIAGSLLDLFLVLAVSSIAFISIGLFITNFIDTQATAVLSSLLIIIPLLFLGGIIFPKEFMPTLIAEFARLLPLYITNELLIAVMTKGASIALLANQVTALLALSAFLLAFTLANKKI